MPCWEEKNCTLECTFLSSNYHTNPDNPRLHFISHVQLIQSAKLILKPVPLTTPSLNTGHRKYPPGSGGSWHHPPFGISPSDRTVLCPAPSVPGRGQQDGWAQTGCKQCERTTLTAQLSQGYLKASTEGGLPRTLRFCVFSHCRHWERLGWIHLHTSNRFKFKREISLSFLLNVSGQRSLREQDTWGSDLMDSSTESESQNQIPLSLKCC